MTAGTIIIGAGQAGAETAFTLRKLGYQKPIHIIGKEPSLPYQRPPLSKTFLKGEIAPERLLFKPAEIYQREKIRVLTKTEAAKILREKKTLRLKNGENLAYDHLVLATGGEARQLNIPGASLRGVHLLRKREDSENLRQAAQKEGRIVIVGGGYIGLEVAASLKQKGCDVILLEAEPRLLSRVAAPEISAFFQEIHEAHGVEIRCGARLVSLEGRDQVEALRLDGGEMIKTPLALIGVGLCPNTGLAERAGLLVADGVMTDIHSRTSDPFIFAAGDCANHPSRIYRRRLRLESVQNAIAQAQSAAAAICGCEKPYIEVPWFWSDQYDVKWQMAGLSEGYDGRVVRGEMGGRRFSVFYLRGGFLIAADAINSAADFMAARLAIAAGVFVDMGRLGDESCSVREALGI